MKAPVKRTNWNRKDIDQHVGLTTVAPPLLRAPQRTLRLACLGTIAIALVACSGGDPAAADSDGVIDVESGIPGASSPAGPSNPQTSGSNPAGISAPGPVNNPPNAPGADPGQPGNDAPPPVVPVQEANLTPRTSTGGNLFFDGGNCGDVGKPLLRRLTRVELRNTLVDLFGGEGVPPTEVLVDPVYEGFRISATGAIIQGDNAGGAWELQNYFEQVAEWAVQTRLNSVSPCSNKDNNCARQFIESFGSKAFRQPFPQELMQSYQSIFDAQQDFPHAAQAVISTMLQSPFFLYRKEIGAPGNSGVNELSTWELAENLAYSTTHAPPDAQLRSAAQDSSIKTPAVFRSHAERLLRSERAISVVEEFLLAWLEVEGLPREPRDQAKFDLNDNLRQAMLTETSMLFLETMRNGGTLNDFLTTRDTFVNTQLGQFYQIAGGAGDQFERVTVPESASRAPGFLGHASFLASHGGIQGSSPVRRGVAVQQRLLCFDIPDPPPGTPTDIPVDPTLTTRERYNAHLQQGTSCNACHAFIDPVGFVFESYDEFGRYRTVDNNKPVDDSGHILLPDHSANAGQPVEFQGIDGLVQHLSGRIDDVGACFSRFVGYYTYGLEGCSQKQLVDTAIGQNWGLMEVFLAALEAPHFSMRASQ